MRSRTTTELFRYWNTIRGERDLPCRDEIEPGDIRTLLPNLFILERQMNGGITFRLAGTHVCALFGHELRGQQFAALWLGEEADNAARIADQVMTRCTPVILSASGRTASGERLDAELLLAPLASSEGTSDRVLGALSPLSRPQWLHMTPLTHLVAEGLRILDPAKANLFLESPSDVALPNTKVGIADGFGQAIRKVLHLQVFEGGRRS